MTQYTPEELMAEVWLPIVGWEESHEVSDIGRVRSIPRIQTTIQGFARSVQGRMLAQTFTDRGYVRVNLVFTPKRATASRIHQLVAAAFIPNPLGLPEVNHIDGEKRNNRKSNLEWATRKSNMQHASKLGLLKPVRGEDNPGSKLTERDVRKIIELRQHMSIPALALLFKVSRTLIFNIDKQIAWKHVV